MMKFAILVLLGTLAAASASCANDCSGHGSCNVYSACQCYRNWMGADCSERVCYFGLAFVDTPQGDLNTDSFVSGNGVRSRSWNQDTWEIYPTYAGWGGVHYQVTPGAAADGFAAVTTGGSGGEAHFYKECSNKGICDRGAGTCSCFPGFVGEGCTRTACPNECSGHGTCSRMVDTNPEYRGWDASATQSCQCDPGYGGVDCGMRLCPKGDDPVTKYEGFTRVTFKSKASAGAKQYYDTSVCFDFADWDDTLEQINVSVVDDTEAPSAQSEVRNFFPADKAQPHLTQKRVWTHEVLSCLHDSGLSVSGLTTGTARQYCYNWNPWYSRGGEHALSGEYKGTDPSSSTTPAVNSHVITHTHQTDEGCAANGVCQDPCYYGFTEASQDLCMQNPVRYGGSSTFTTFAANHVTATCTAVSMTKGTLVKFATSGAIGVVADTTSSATTFGVKIISGRLNTDASFTSNIHVGDNLTNGHAGTVTFTQETGCDAATFTVVNSAGGTAHNLTNGVSAASIGDLGIDAKYSEVAIVTHRMVATGSDSQASGVLTGGGCIGPDVDVTSFATATNNAQSTLFECPNLDFWSMYLKDVKGTFQVGDTINIKGYAYENTADGVNTDVHATFVQTDDDQDLAFNYDLCNYVDSIDTYYANNEKTMQGDEEQIMTIDFAAMATAAGPNSFRGYFALEFTDEMGDKWMTEAISVSSYATSTAQRFTDLGESPTTEPMADFVTSSKYYLPEGHRCGWAMDTLADEDGRKDPARCVALEMQRALEALPNQIIPDIQVEYIQDKTNSDANRITERNFMVSFVGNSGNIPELRVAYAFTDREGDDSDDLAAFTNASCRGSMERCFEHFTGAFDPVTGTTDRGMVDYILPPSWSATSTRAYIRDTSVTPFPQSYQQIESMPNQNRYGRDGTKENVECSNRGLCDYSAGLCKCFAGYTGVDCSTQNALAM
jgi:hypothetical protein